jgi:hypothetical protein
VAVYGQANSRELVDSNDDLQAEFLGVLDVLAQVGTTLLEKLKVLLLVDLSEGLSWGNGWTTAVHLSETHVSTERTCEGETSSTYLQCSHGGDKDHSVGLQARLSALDVAELCLTLKSQIPQSR